jgi:hypothetical protein
MSMPNVVQNLFSTSRVSNKAPKAAEVQPADQDFKEVLSTVKRASRKSDSEQADENKSAQTSEKVEKKLSAKAAKRKKDKHDEDAALEARVREAAKGKESAPIDVATEEPPEQV